MNFVHTYLLFGLALAAVPVALHLLMRQKPKRLPFPALRFLKARSRTNRRKLNLQNLLLLLRVAVLCALCLALSAPTLFAGRGGTTDRPVFAVLLFDTSPSMAYAVSGVSRLDDAKGRGRELLEEMASGSSVVVLDAADPQPDAAVPVAEARDRIDALRIQNHAGPLNRPVAQALEFLDRQDKSDSAPPRVLYVFCDRTRASWDAAGVRPTPPDGVKAVYVDVGPDRPRDLGIEKVELVPPVVPPGATYEVRVRLRGTPGGHENVLSCEVDGVVKDDRQPVKLAKEFTAETLSFERQAPEPAAGPGEVPARVVVRLGTRDNLTVNDARHATLHVRRGRRMLAVVDDGQMKQTVRDPSGRVVPKVARFWDAAVAANKSFAVEYRPTSEAAKAVGDYPVVCLFQTTAVPDALWLRLLAFVRAGGGLAVVPAGRELADVEAFDAGGRDLLPAPLAGVVEAAAPVYWEPFGLNHPLAMQFGLWKRSADADFDRLGLRPFVRRYWKLGPLAPGAGDVARYATKGRDVALADRAVDRGRVVLFTSPLDLREQTPGGVRWDNYLESSFGLVLIDRVCLYLSGQSAAAEANFVFGGPPPRVPVPAGVEGPFALAGAGLSDAQKAVRLKDGELTFAADLAAGNYRVLDAKGRATAGFSLDVRGDETDLGRVPVEQIEAALGEGSVVSVGRAVRLRDALAGARRPPVDLTPYLMMALLVVLMGEGVLANRFYRRTKADEPA